MDENCGCGSLFSGLGVCVLQGNAYKKENQQNNRKHEARSFFTRHKKQIKYKHLKASGYVRKPFLS